jgi:hypothetical protein
MTPPKLAGIYLAYACLLGAGLGLVYGFLRPLRRRMTQIADGLFVVTVLLTWVYFSFRICDGALRLGYWAGFAAGGFAWDRTLGRLLQPVFSIFWDGICSFLGFPIKIIRKIFKKIYIFTKKLFASWKKSGTIKCDKLPFSGKNAGGHRHGKPESSPSPHSSGVQTYPHDDQSSGSVRYCVVYSHAADPAGRPSERPKAKRGSAGSGPAV